MAACQAMSEQVYNWATSSQPIKQKSHDIVRLVIDLGINAKISNVVIAKIASAGKVIANHIKNAVEIVENRSMVESTLIEGQTLERVYNAKSGEKFIKAINSEKIFTKRGTYNVAENVNAQDALTRKMFALDAAQK